MWRVTGRWGRLAAPPGTGKQGNSRNCQRGGQLTEKAREQQGSGTESKAKEERERGAREERRNKKEIDWEDGRKGRRSRSSKPKQLPAKPCFCPSSPLCSTHGRGQKVPWEPSAEWTCVSSDLILNRMLPRWATGHFKCAKTVCTVFGSYICTPQRKDNPQMHWMKKKKTRWLCTLQPWVYKFLTQNRRLSCLASSIFSFSIDYSHMSVFYSLLSVKSTSFCSRTAWQHTISAVLLHSAAFVHDMVLYCMSKWPIMDNPI